jgi:hypothetical protein
MPEIGGYFEELGTSSAPPPLILGVGGAAYRGSVFEAKAWCIPRDHRGPKIWIWVHAYGRPHDELNNCDN